MTKEEAQSWITKTKLNRDWQVEQAAYCEERGLPDSIYHQQTAACLGLLNVLLSRIVLGTMEVKDGR